MLWRRSSDCGPVAVRIAAPPRLLGAFQGVLDRNLTTAGSKRFFGNDVARERSAHQLPVHPVWWRRDRRSDNPSRRR